MIDKATEARIEAATKQTRIDMATLTRAYLDALVRYVSEKASCLSHLPSQAKTLPPPEKAIAIASIMDAMFAAHLAEHIDGVIKEHYSTWEGEAALLTYEHAQAIFSGDGGDEPEVLKETQPGGES